MLSRSPSGRHLPLSRALPCAVIALAAFATGCAPERIDMNVHDIFTSDAARYALQSQMSPGLLSAVGGFLPDASWPVGAPPLLVDLQVIAENKIDLAASGIDVSGYNSLRLHWTQLVIGSTNEGALLPRPTKIEVYVGPATTTSIHDPGVVPFASGAFPGVVIGECDGGTTSCASIDLGDGGSTGPEVDGGLGFSQSLVHAADAQLALSNLVFAAQPFAFYVVLHLPIDSVSDPTLPLGGADLLFDVQYELAR